MGNMTHALANTTEEGLEMCVQAYRAQTGCPTIYNELIAAEIIDRLANGETMRDICSDKHMPNYSTVYDWINRGGAFANSIARARRAQATILVEEGKQILDDCDDDSMSRVQKADKRANFRMKLAQCFDRETYGEKVQQDINLRGVVIHTDNTKLAALMDDD